MLIHEHIYLGINESLLCSVNFSSLSRRATSCIYALSFIQNLDINHIQNRPELHMGNLVA